MTIKRKLHEIIFEAETRAGRLFDVVLIIAIVLSVATSMTESVAAIRQGREQLFFYLEVGFTLFFSIEYALRIYCSKNTSSYAFSFFGIVDLLATLPVANSCHGDNRPVHPSRNTGKTIARSFNQINQCTHDRNTADHSN